MTDLNIGNAGNEERFVFLFEPERLRSSGLAAEIVIPPDQLAVAEPEDLKKQRLSWSRST